MSMECEKEYSIIILKLWWYNRKNIISFANLGKGSTASNTTVQNYLTHYQVPNIYFLTIFYYSQSLKGTNFLK